LIPYSKFFYYICGINVCIFFSQEQSATCLTESRCPVRTTRACRTPARRATSAACARPPGRTSTVHTKVTVRISRKGSFNIVHIFASVPLVFRKKFVFQIKIFDDPKKISFSLLKKIEKNIKNNIIKSLMYFYVNKKKSNLMTQR
jgi:hypothetical protein